MLLFEVKTKNVKRWVAKTGSQLELARGNNICRSKLCFLSLPCAVLKLKQVHTIMLNTYPSPMCKQT
jgi:hypothetical protein